MIHLVARIQSPGRPFADSNLAAPFWRKLRLCFPEALSAVLMPNHLHLLLPKNTDAAVAWHRLKVLISRSQLRWEAVPMPELIQDPKHARRQARYIALNPCRSGLAGDPLEWQWSTYRGYFGALANPWVDPKKLAALYERSSLHTFLPWFHEYVSSDNTVRTTGTPFLKSTSSSEIRHYPLEQIILAVLAAAEESPAILKTRQQTSIRRAIIHLAAESGWNQTRLLAEQFHTTPRSVQYLRKDAPNPKLMQAARVCLGDARMTASLNAKF